MRYLIYNQVAGMLNSLRKKARVELLVKPSATSGTQEPDSAPASQAADDASADSASASSAAPTKKAGQKT